MKSTIESTDSTGKPSPLVVTQSLTKKFGKRADLFTALDDCTLSIPQGEVFGLLGPNGAGKSTLIRLLLGFMTPTSGTARIGGLNCHLQRVDVHRIVSYLPGDARTYRIMRAKNVLKLFCSFRENASFEKATKIADRLELDLSRWVGLMSTGMRQKLALAIALSVDSPMLILDEPTANLDPTVRGQVMKMINEAKFEGRTVIFSSHVLSEIEDTCDRVGILRKGKLVHLEPMSSLKMQNRIRATLKGRLPEIPESLSQQMSVKQVDNNLQIETPAELSTVLKWLAEVPLADLMIQPVGLRAVYDRFHHESSIATLTEVNG
ncbi:MAG: ABC transporter ATP-binding protein [Mariniblastus sp.]